MDEEDVSSNSYIMLMLCSQEEALIYTLYNCTSLSIFRVTEQILTEGGFFLQGP